MDLIAKKHFEKILKRLTDIEAQQLDFSDRLAALENIAVKLYDDYDDLRRRLTP